MTIESAKAFYERMLTDEAFRTQHQNAESDDERREVVLAAGYDFTPEEWETALAQISVSSDSELSDAELSAVSGGTERPLVDGFCGTPSPGWSPKDPLVFPMYGLPII